MELSFFKKRPFHFATISAGIQSTAAAFVIIPCPLFFMEGLDFSGSVVGIFMALLAVPFLLISPVSGRLSDKIGSIFLSTRGVSIFCVVLCLLSRLAEHPTRLGIGIAVMLSGVGMAIFQLPNNSAIIGSVPRSMLGTTSSIAIATRQVGSSSGIKPSPERSSAATRHNFWAAYRIWVLIFQRQKIVASIAGYQETILGGAYYRPYRNFHVAGSRASSKRLKIESKANFAPMLDL